MSGFDDNLRLKLSSGLYNFSKITKDTKISRYWLDKIKKNVCTPDYILVALNAYFEKLEG